MIRVIWDNGTPACLPKWAKNEIVQRRVQDWDAFIAIQDANRSLERGDITSAHAQVRLALQALKRLNG